jgi:hypothetical protein
MLDDAALDDAALAALDDDVLDDDALALPRSCDPARMRGTVRGEVVEYALAHNRAARTRARRRADDPPLRTHDRDREALGGRAGSQTTA